MSEGDDEISAEEQAAWAKAEMTIAATFHRGVADKEGDVPTGAKFAHYTSAKVLHGILSSPDTERGLWLRNAVLMNDFNEIEYGQDLFRQFLDDGFARDNLFEAAVAIDPALLAAFDWVDFEQSSIKDCTFLLSLALHKDDQLERGSLNMWRAYGGDENICLLLNPEKFLVWRGLRGVDLVRVDYGGAQSFYQELHRISQGMRENRDALRELPPGFLAHVLKGALDRIILSAKHPAFSEENEWRLIFTRRDENAINVPPSKVVEVDGVIQEVFWLPITKKERHGWASVDLNDLLYRVLVGPTLNSDLVVRSIARLLVEAGVADASNKVASCHIPLRR